MESRGVKWNSRTYRAVALAYVRSGLVDKARAFLSENAKQLQTDTVGIYRELIQHYNESRGDHLRACQLSVDFIENNRHLTFSDWHNALQLTYELPDRDLYWRIRKRLWLYGAASEQRMPSHLMLTEREGRVGRGLSLFRDESSDMVQHLMPPKPVDVSLALEVFDDIWNADGSGLTRNTATKLLVTMIEHERLGDCVEMLEFFKEHRVSPKAFALSAAFRLFCDANDDDQALQVVEMLVQDGVSLKARDRALALSVAMKLNKHELVNSIVRHMKKKAKHLSASEFEQIASDFGRTGEWESTIRMLPVSKH